MKIKEDEFNCNECYFQGTSKAELSKHFNMKHTTYSKEEENAIKCKICGAVGLACTDLGARTPIGVSGNFK